MDVRWHDVWHSDSDIVSNIGEGRQWRFLLGVDGQIDHRYSYWSPAPRFSEDFLYYGTVVVATYQIDRQQLPRFEFAVDCLLLYDCHWASVAYCRNPEWRCQYVTEQ